MNFQDRYEAWLATWGKRLKGQRRAIADVVAVRPGPFTADDLLAAVGSTISRPTVFRTLNELVRAELLKVRGGGGASGYVPRAG
ncbi:MAG: hypothetical protein HYS13_14840 [Planctomycetia bacterium]|nr:hypothetical protein [Planctomycetia bacterium]